MSQAWTEEQTNFIKKNLNLANTEITDLYNRSFPATIRSYSSIQKKANLLRVLEDIEEEIEEESARLPLMEKSEFGEKINKWLSSVTNYFKGIKHQPLKSAESSLCLLLSDLHFGKQTKQFNIETAKKYISEIPAHLQDKYGSRSFDEVVVILDGDIVEGEDIYSTQNGQLETPVIFQTQAAVESLFQLLLDLEVTFQCQIRVETAYGNHGRMSKTADPRSNWDNVVYMMLYKLVELEGNRNIIFNLNFEEFTVCEVKDKRLLITHHGTKHMGTPAMKVKFLGWVIDEDVDLVMHGHWHQWKVESELGRIMLSNGSLSGKDDLAQQMGVSEPARQAVFMVTPHQPINEFSFIQWT